MTLNEFAQLFSQETQAALRPLRNAFGSPGNLSRFLTGAGWELKVRDVAQLASWLESAENRLEGYLSTTPMSEAEAVAGLSRGSDDGTTFVSALTESLLAVNGEELEPRVAEVLAEDVGRRLVIHHIQETWPTVFFALRVLRIIGPQPVSLLTANSHPEGCVVRLPVQRLDFPQFDTVLANPLAILTGSREEGVAGLIAQSDQWRSEVRELWDSVKSTTFSIEVTTQGIEVAGIPSTIIPEGSTPIEVSLPYLEGWRVRLEESKIKLRWPGAGAGDVLPLFEAEGLVIGLPTGSDPAIHSGLKIEASGDGFTATLRGGLAAQIPLELVGADDGDELWMTGAAEIVLPMATPEVEILLARVGPLNLRLGDALRIENAAAEIRNLVMPPRPSAVPWSFAAAGRLVLDDGRQSSFIEISTSWDGTSFRLESLADVALPGGFRISGPDASTPVFSVQWTPGSATIALEIGGKLTLPTAVDNAPAGANSASAVSVSVAGSFDGQIVDGRLVITAGSLSSSVNLSAWRPVRGFTLEEVGFSLAWSAAEGITTKAEGRLAIGEGHVDAELALVIPDVQQPLALKATGSLTAEELDFEMAKIIGGTLSASVDTIEQRAEATVVGARAGIFPKSAGALAANDFQLFVNDVDASLKFEEGIDVSLTKGSLQITNASLGSGTQSPTATLVETNPIRLAWNPGTQVPLAFSGAVEFRDFASQIGGDEGPRLAVDHAVLVFSLTGAALINAAGFLSLPLHDDKELTIAIEGFRLGTDGAPLEGSAFLAEDVAIDLGGGLELLFLGEDGGQLPPCGIEVQVQGSESDVVLAGGMEFRMPLGTVSRHPEDPNYADGDRLSMSIGGSLRFPSTTGAAPILDGLTASIEGTFTLGRTGGNGGIRIEDARLEASGLQNFLRPRANDPLILTLSGVVAIPDDGPRAGLRNLKLVFEGGQPKAVWPDRFEFDAGDELFDGFPLSLRDVTVELDSTEGPLTEIFHPSNIEIGFDLSLGFSLGDIEASARTDGVKVSFDDEGWPNFTLEGVGFLLEDVLDLGVVSLGGGVYLGGLNHLIPQPDPGWAPDVSEVFVAGKLGGFFNGMGAEALLAAKPASLAPWGGIAIEIQGGAAGIPLGPTGILFTGAEVGISFANTNSDPTKLSTYVDVPDHPDDGSPVITGEPPQDSADASGDVPSTARPVHAEDDRPACPGECPPPSMNLLCQPHPDFEAYPGKAILKFTSIDEDFLDSLPSPEPALSLKDWLQQSLQLSPGLIASEVIDLAVGGLLELLPPVDTVVSPAGMPDPSDEVLAVFKDPATTIRQALLQPLTEALEDRGGVSIYETVRRFLYKGCPCPDISIQAKGTFSYTGISSVASITGGVSLSTTGSMGIMGSLNVLGIPVGRAKLYEVFTTPNGLPKVFPTLCGDVRVSLGPLELGALGAEFSVDGFESALTSVMVGLTASATSATARVLREHIAEMLTKKAWRDASESATSERGWEVIERVSPDDVDLATFAATASVADWYRLAGRLLSNPPADALGEVAFELFSGLYNALDPRLVMCGMVKPALFGLPLTGGESLVEVQAWANKTRIGARYAFSPTYLFGRVIASGLLPAVDQAALGFEFGLPKPEIEEIQENFAAQLDAAGWEAFMKKRAEDSLLRSTVTISYTLSPLGLRCATASARLLIPKLNPHPEAPGRRWTPPWQERNTNKPKPHEVLVALLEESPRGEPWLADPSWDRTLEDIVVEDRDAPTGSLEDYFPHGGVLGAVSIDLPRALTDAPPQEHIGRILDTQAPFPERLESAMAVIQQLTTTRQTGRLAFYVPAPHPPAASMDGISSQEFLHFLNYPNQLSPVFPEAWAFARGRLRAQVLGIPLAEADLLVEDDRFTCTTTVPEESFLHPMIGSASAILSISRRPSLPVDLWFLVLERAIARKPDTKARLLNAVKLLEKSRRKEAEDRARHRANQDNDAVEIVAAEMGDEAARQVEAVVDNVWQRLGPAIRRQRGSNRVAKAVIGVLGAGLTEQLPRVEIGFEATDLQLPEPLSTVFGNAHSSAELRAYSPGFDLRATDELASLKKHGGLAISISTTLDAFGMTGSVAGHLTVSKARSGKVRLAGTLDVKELRIPGLTVHSAELIVEGSKAHISGQIEAASIGVFDIKALTGRYLPFDVNLKSGQISFGPAKLTSPFFMPSTKITLHGSDDSKPATFALDAPWSAKVSMTEVRLRNPIRPRSTLFNAGDLGTLGISGHGFEKLNLTLPASRLATSGWSNFSALGRKPTGSLGSWRFNEKGFRYEKRHRFQMGWAQAKGTLAISAQASPGLGGSITLDDAEIQVGTFKWTGSASIASDRVTGQFTSSSTYLGTADLMDAGANRWLVELTRSRLQVEAKSGRKLRYFGKSVSNVTKVKITLSGAGLAIEAHSTNAAWLSFLGGQIGFKPESLSLSTAGRVAFSGQVRAFKKSGSSYRIRRDFSFDAGKDFETVLATGSGIPFLSSPSSSSPRILERLNNTSLLIKKENTTWSLLINGARLRLPGASAQNFSAAFKSNGTLDIEVGKVTINTGLFTYRTDNPARVKFVPGQIPSLYLPAARIKAPSIPGWPSNGYTFPSLNTEHLKPSRTRYRNGSANVWRTIVGSLPTSEYSFSSPKLKLRLDQGKVKVRVTGGRIAARIKGFSASKVSLGFPESSITSDGKVSVRTPAISYRPPSIGGAPRPPRISVPRFSFKVHFSYFS